MEILTVRSPDPFQPCSNSVTSVPFTWTQQSWLSQVLRWGPWGPGFAGDPLPPPTHRRAEVRCPRVQRGCWAAPLRVGVATPNRSWHSWVILELKVPLKSLFHSWWEDGSLDISGYLMMLTYSFLVNIPFSHPIPVLDHSRSSTPAVEHRPVQRPPRSSRTCPHPGHLWSVEVHGKIYEAVADQQIHLAIDSFNSLAVLDSFAGCSEKPPLDVPSSESHCLAGK